MAKWIRQNGRDIRIVIYEWLKVKTARGCMCKIQVFLNIIHFAKIQCIISGLLINYKVKYSHFLKLKMDILL